MTKWIFAPQDERKTHHFEPAKKDYKIKQMAYLSQEGIGVNGTFFVKGTVVTRGSNLFVSAMGFTSAMQTSEFSGAFEFYGNVSLIANGEVLARKRFKQGNHELWPDNQYAPIGSVMFYLPPSEDPSIYKVKIKAGYWFDGGVGTITPMPAMGETEVLITGKGRQ
jgi:hypothetical protein